LGCFDDIGLAASWIFPNGLYTILLALLLTRYLQTPVNLPKEIKELVTHSTNSGWNQIAGYEDR